MSWKAEYVLLIVASTAVDYIAGWKIYHSEAKNRKRAFLIMSLLVNLGLLFTFKYWNFFSESFRSLLATYAIPLHPMTIKVLLPVGISFYTFQTLSYTIDIYRGRIKPQRHPGIFAVYVAYFPQLVAGPIERAKNLLPQFLKEHKFEYQRVVDGLKMMAWGFFKKVVIADRLAVFVDTIYGNPAGVGGLDLALATLFFGVQIYCDFSGYSDIAIGAAKIMGINLMENFRRPYYADSVRDFWRRWHISLSTWFRDYLYIPLGGNRLGKWRQYFNVFMVFFISGLWHGANWTFLIWGALHGFYLLVQLWTDNIRKRFAEWVGLSNMPRLHKVFSIVVTFVLVTFAWTFFRSNNIRDALHIAIVVLKAAVPWLWLIILIPVAVFAITLFHKNVKVKGWTPAHDYLLKKIVQVVLIIVMIIILRKFYSFGTTLMVSAICLGFLVYGGFMSKRSIFDRALWYVFIALIALVVSHWLIDVTGLFIVIVAIVLMEMAHLLHETGVSKIIAERPALAQWSIYIAFVLIILLFGVFEKVQFIYFQF